MPGQRNQPRETFIGPVVHFGINPQVDRLETVIKGHLPGVSPLVTPDPPSTTR